MTKNVIHGTKIVNFVSRYKETNTYSVYDRTTRETDRINRSDEGMFSATCREPTQDERDAVEAFRSAEHADYLEWRKQNAALFA